MFSSDGRLIILVHTRLDRLLRYLPSLLFGTKLLVAGTAVLAAGADGAETANATSLPFAEHKAEVTLAAKPVTCVALHKNQTCFQKVTLSWRLSLREASELDTLALQNTRLCLYTNRNESPVTCWLGTRISMYVYDYSAADAVQFELRAENSSNVLAQVIVSTSWVYRTGRRSSSGWRLF